MYGSSAHAAVKLLIKYGSGTAVTTYDAIEEFNVDWKVECDQLNLAHATTKNILNEETETKTKLRCPHSSVGLQVQDPWRQFGKKKDYMEERIYERDEF